MNLKLMKNLCRLDVQDLREILAEYLKERNYTNVLETDMYVIAEGELPVCLVAHMDTVFSYLPQEFFYDKRKKVLWSPDGTGFDDRAGIYAILMCIEAGYRPSVIFTNQEEVGGVGARTLTQTFKECPFKDCRALIQLDRANKEDAVFYDCDNKAFEKYICSFGFKYDWGTFSDISILAPAWKIAAVNLSIGYVDEHRVNERLYCNWCDKTIERVMSILELSPEMQAYAYIPHVYYNPSGGSIYDYGNKYWNRYSDDYFSNDAPLEAAGAEREALTPPWLEKPISQCYICLKRFDNDSQMIEMNDIPGNPYLVCKECYNAFYIPDKEEEKKDEVDVVDLMV